MTEREKFEAWWSDVPFTGIDTARAAWYASAAESAKDYEDLEFQVRDIVAYLGAGGFNSLELTPMQLREKMNWGIAELEKERDSARKEIEQLRERLRVLIDWFEYSNGPPTGSFKLDRVCQEYIDKFDAARQACKEGE